jgi:hypothetical protein
VKKDESKETPVEALRATVEETRRLVRLTLEKAGLPVPENLKK